MKFNHRIEGFSLTKKEWLNLKINHLMEVLAF